MSRQGTRAEQGPAPSRDQGPTPSRDQGPAPSRDEGPTPSHHQGPAPSPWVERFVPAASTTGAGDAAPAALDVACGAGRHARLLRQRGYRVVAVDRDVSGVADLAGDPAVELVEADLEDGGPFPLAGRRFAVIVVANYLHRPLLGPLVDAVAAGGRLLYETFSVDQPAYGRPTNPEWLLAHGELLEVVGGRLRVIAYEDVIDEPPPSGPPAARQRVCADRVA